MKKIKVGIIGFGSVGQRHYANLLNLDCTVIVLTKRDDIKNDNFVSEYNNFLSKGPYELIVISNETYLHFKTIMKVIRLKPKAIFVEKPLALRLEEIEKIKKEAEKNSISLIVGYSRQYYKPYLEIKKIISSKKLGKIYFMRISVGQHITTWRNRDYRQSYTGKKSLGGTLLFDLVHEINFPAWALEEKLNPLCAVLRKQSDLEIDSEDIAECLFLTTGGSLVNIHLDFIRKPERWSCEILGSKRSLTWDSESNKISVKDGTNIFTQKVLDDWNNMFVREMRFIIKIVTRNKYITNIEEAYADTENILKTYEIAR